MSDTINVRRNYATLEKQEQYDGYSKVVIVVDEDNNIQYTAGTDAGRTLTLTCPFGTQQMAQDILGKVMGHQYQPYSATGAHIDPAAEIGDGITVGGVYGGLFTKEVTHGPLYTADVSAPGGEKINYAYPYKTIQKRKIERNFRDISATFKVQAAMIAAEVEERKEQGEQFKAQFEVQAGQIAAKVEKTGGESSSFGWTLDEKSWTLTSNGGTVLKASKDGLEVKGKITATSGKIGGFDIQSNYLSYNSQTWGGTNANGIYLGTSGFQLGKNFKVDTTGKLTASSGEFTGTVHAGSIAYGNENGVSRGYLSGSGLEDLTVGGGKIEGSTLGTTKFKSGVNTSLGYADYSNGVFNGTNKPTTIKCYSIQPDNIVLAGLYSVGHATIRYLDSGGNEQKQKVLTWDYV